MAAVPVRSFVVRGFFPFRTFIAPGSHERIGGKTAFLPRRVRAARAACDQRRTYCRLRHHIVELRAYFPAPVQTDLSANQVGRGAFQRQVCIDVRCDLCTESTYRQAVPLARLQARRPLTDDKCLLAFASPQAHFSRAHATSSRPGETVKILRAAIAKDHAQS